jgi:tetratricopeptide (TPR) repeat protein
MKKFAILSLLPAIFLLCEVNSTGQDKWENYFGGGMRAMQEGDLSKAELLFKASRLKAELEAEAGHPRAHDMMIDSLSGVSVVLREQGRAREAEEVLHEQLELLERLGRGDQDPQKSTSLHNLGLALFDQAKHTAAKEALKRAVELRKKYDPPPRRNLAISLLSYGAVYFQEKNYQQAESVLLQARELLSKISNADRTPADIAALMRSDHNLALILVEQKKYDKAEGSYKAAILSMETLYGKTSPGLILYLNNYAKLLKVLNRTAEAMALEARVKSMKEQTRK